MEHNWEASENSSSISGTLILAEEIEAYSVAEMTIVGQYAFKDRYHTLRHYLSASLLVNSVLNYEDDWTIF